MSRRTSAVAFSSLALITACTAPEGGGIPSQTPSSHVAIDDAPRKVVPPSAAATSRLAAASNALGGDLYAKLQKPGENLAFSPASISMALAMTWTGARGTTRDEMTKTLHFDGDPAEITRSAGELLSVFDDPNRKDYTLSVVNRLFGEQSYPFDRGFLAGTRDDFGAELTKVDFIKSFEPARADINAYVAKTTHDKIENLLPPGSLDDATRLVLVNAMYLHADWMVPFEKESTSPAAFHVSADKSVDVPTMHEDARLAFADVDGARVLEVPYKGGDLTMTLLLPDDASKLAELESHVEKNGFGDLAAKTTQKLVHVALPKFKVEPAASYALAPTLSELGMPTAFTNHADFSGMIAPGSEAPGLSVADVYHKTFVAVDELGTEAAAATGVVMSTESMKVEPEPEAEFVADHPFLFAIRDVKSGMVLFEGRVNQPAS